jgi:hypothetical protein
MLKADLFFGHIMSPSSLTALIITVHDLYALIGLVIFGLLGMLIFFILYKLGLSKSANLLLSVIFALTGAFFLVDHFLGKKPLSVEVIRAG